MQVTQHQTPVFKAPPQSCDSHFHVFGQPEHYSYGPELRYRPPHAPLTEYLALARHLGMERMVFVQPSAYGRDNSCMLDAMRTVGPSLCRGVVDVDETIPDSELARLNVAGVRGIRINTSPVKPPQFGHARELMKRIERLDARCAEIGWHLDFLGPGWLTAELFDCFRRLRVDFTIAHLGMFLARDGVKQPGFVQLIDLLRHGSGRAWIKLTGAYRISAKPDFSDVAPMVRALIEAAPHRVIWGSDYPHLSFADRAGSVDLFNLLAEWAPDEMARHAILVDNPQSLYRF